MSDGGASGPIGYFGIELVRIELVQPQTSIVNAELWSSDPPTTFRLTTTMREGECELRTTDIPFCPERCTGDSVCFADGICQRRPTAIPLNTVSISGLRRVDAAMTSTLVPNALGAELPGEQLQYPPFAEGETIRWSVGATAALPAITMDMPAIDELRVLSLMPVSAPNMPLDVRWEPPRGAVPEGQRVIVGMDFTHHAGLRGMITCTTADDGAFTIPASLITGLHALGTAGWPALFVTRSVQRTMTVNGARMNFEVKSEKEIYVSIAGLISCHENAECPDGRMCRANFTCAP